MKKIIMIWGTDADYLESIATTFSSQGDTVYQSIQDPTNTIHTIEQAHGYLDTLILCPSLSGTPDGNIEQIHDYNEMSHVITDTLNHSKESLELAIPLLRKGSTKKIVLYTHEESSIRCNTQTNHFAYHMSLASLNMMLSIYFNTYRPEGFEFRCLTADDSSGLDLYSYVNLGLSYHPTWIDQFSEENRFVMRTSTFDELSW